MLSSAVSNKKRNNIKKIKTRYVELRKDLVIDK